MIEFGPKVVYFYLHSCIEKILQLLRGEADLASLTAGKRVPWAEARLAHFRHGVNGRSLKAIESAAFCVSLDEEEPQLDTSENLSKYAKSLLHGNTNNRW